VHHGGVTRSDPTERADAGGYSPVAAILGWMLWCALLAAVVSTVTGVSTKRALAQVAGWVLVAGVLGHLVARLGAIARVACVALGTGLVGVLAVDLYAFVRANQGLWVLAEIRHNEGWQGVARALDESGVGAATLLVVSVAPFVVGAAVGKVWNAPARWWPQLALGQPGRAWLGVVVVAAGLIGLVPGARSVPSVLSAFYGPDRMATRFVAAGTPPSIRLSKPPSPPVLDGPPPVSTLAADAAKTVVLVIIESLRSDAIEPQTAPNLHRFANGAIGYPNARSAANATHASWYTLLFSAHGLWWHRLASRTESKRLPPPIQAFSDAGYRVHVRSAAGLNYYRVADIAFGRDRERASSYLDAVGCHARGARTRAEMDKCAIDSAVKLLTNPAERGERSLLIVLLDSTHFPYHWDTAKPRFAPVVDEATFKAGAYEDIEHAKNRYRSALFSADRQFGRLMQALAPLRKDGVIVAVTGDHGEEFNEHGKLTHDSELCDIQTRVPLLFSGVAGLIKPGDKSMGSHVDVMPTLLWAVGLRDAATSDVHGLPLQRKVRKWAFVVHTSAGSPFLVAFQTVDRTLELTVSDRRDAAKVRELFLLQTYPTGPPKGTRVGHDDAARSDIAATFGSGLRAVFGASSQDILRRSKVRAIGGSERYGFQMYDVREVVWPPSAATPGVVEVTVRNTGNTSWLHDVGLSYHWLDAEGRPIKGRYDNKRSALPAAIHPRESAKVQITVHAPPCPTCVKVALDIVREHVAWISKHGSKSPVVDVPATSAIDGSSVKTLPISSSLSAAAP